MSKKILFVMAVFLAFSVLAPRAQQQAPPRQPGIAGQQPPITFKVEVNYVEIDASVTDAQGNFVGGLTKDDFEVLEDRKPQTVTVFSAVDIPVERPAPPLFARSPIPPDVRSNAKAFNGRVFVLVLDDLHTLAVRTQLVRSAARQFVDRYAGANDLVAVVHTGGRFGGAQDFTNNTHLLDRAVDSFIGRKLRSATLEKIEDYNRMRMLGLTPTDPKDSAEMQRAYNARVALETLKNVADYMVGVRGRRKAVVYFGEGLDYDIANIFENQFASDVIRATQQAIGAATRANVSFYTVDARGLSGLSDEIMDIANVPEDGSLGPSTLEAELRLSQDSLRILSEETGGIAVVNRGDYRDAFARIIQDNSSYYVLGYYASNAKRDGRFRHVQVRVRRPGLQVRARRGYVAPTGRAVRTPVKRVAPPDASTSAELRDALNSPVPVSGLGLSVSAAVFRGQGPKASVALTVDVEGSKLRFSQDGGVFVDDVELSFVAQDQAGKGQGGGHDVVNLRLRPQTREVVQREGVSIARRVELAPGVYQVRVGARETGGGALGSVLYDLEVPDFSRPALAMSHIVVASEQIGAPAVNPDAELKAVLPGAPTARREFPRGDTLSVFAEVYDNGKDVAHRVGIKTSVLSEDGKVVYTRGDERQSAELQGARKGGYGYTAQVPLATLARGRYVLRVEAESSLGDHPAARRELEFRIR